jgi:hypothetical protein
MEVSVQRHAQAASLPDTHLRGGRVSQSGRFGEDNNLSLVQNQTTILRSFSLSPSLCTDYSNPDPTLF